ncbi:MAG: tetratricopeptide repeat protein [Ignavibacterium album]|uniref:tetratricopeptide repeat protein n=1 Tax=Ignavibacterium album TaxID=591197 RepID=UPI0026F1BC8F|nr:tetratricopeptide repeat protein [Ignavibacterium album]MBI5662758.1 tetratricopeptide repeat protein [Ignavibacterium album]
MKKTLFILFLVVELFAQQNPFDINQFMLAEAYEQQGNYSKAIEIIEQLYTKDTQNPNYFNKLVNLYITSKNFDAAVSLLNSRIKMFPQDPDNYGQLGSVYYMMGDYKKAKDVWEIPLAKTNRNSMNFRVIANYAIERRAFETAIEFLNRGKKESDDPTMYSFDLGELYSLTMQYENATKEYCELLKKNPGLYSTVEAKIFSFINKPEALQPTIKVVSSYQSQDVVFKLLLAKLMVEDKKYDKAFELYIEVDKIQNTGGQLLIDYANFLFNEEKFQLAKEAYEFIIKNFPESKQIPSAKLGLTKTLESLTLQEFRKLNPEWKTFYSTVYLTEEKTQKILSAYKEVIDLYKHSEIAIEARYRSALILYYVNNKPEKAIEQLNEIINLYPTSTYFPKALIELGNIYLQTAQIEIAKEKYLSAQNSSRVFEDDRNIASLQLSKVLASEGNFNAAIESLKKITFSLKNDLTNDALEFSLIMNTAKNDSSNLVKFCKAEIFTEQKNFTSAKSIYEEIALNPQAFVLHSICKLRSAEMELALNNYPEALKKLGAIVDEEEKNIYSDKALYLTAKIYEYGIIDLSKAIESYQKLLGRFPKSIYLDEARERIQHLREKMKEGKTDV